MKSSNFYDRTKEKKEEAKHLTSKIEIRLHIQNT